MLVDDDMGYSTTLDGDLSATMAQIVSDPLPVQNSTFYISTTNTLPILVTIEEPEGAVWRTLDDATEIEAVTGISAQNFLSNCTPCMWQGEVAMVYNKYDNISQTDAFLLRIPATGAVTTTMLPSHAESVVGSGGWSSYVTGGGLKLIPRALIGTNDVELGLNNTYTVDSSWVITGSHAVVFDHTGATPAEAERFGWGLFVYNDTAVYTTNNSIQGNLNNSVPWIIVDISTSTKTSTVLEVPTELQLPGITDFLTNGGSSSLAITDTHVAVVFFYTGPTIISNIVTWNLSTGAIDAITPFTTDSLTPPGDEDVHLLSVPTFQISGIVSLDGTPEENAKVTVYSTQDGRFVDTTLTDVIGAYTLQMYTATPKTVVAQLSNGTRSVKTITPTLIP
jgi:hypothetical protein